MERQHVEALHEVARTLRDKAKAREAFKVAQEQWDNAKDRCAEAFNGLCGLATNKAEHYEVSSPSGSGTQIVRVVLDEGSVFAELIEPTEAKANGGPRRKRPRPRGRPLDSPPLPKRLSE